MIKRITTGSQGTQTIQGDNFSFSLRQSKDDVNSELDVLRNKINNHMRTHLKKTLKGAAVETSNEIKNRSVKDALSGSTFLTMGAAKTAPLLIGNSLGYNFNFATRDEIGYTAGSYDKDEGLDTSSRFSSIRGSPTGIRATNMKKNDPSLTEIYDVTQGRFEITGIISNPKQTSGIVRGGTTARWKRQQENRGKVFYSLKGYGKNIKMKERKGKAPKVIRKGWKGLNSVAAMQRNYTNRLNNSEQFQRELENIRTNMKETQQMTLRDF